MRLMENITTWEKHFPKKNTKLSKELVNYKSNRVYDDIMQSTNILNTSL